MSEYRIQLRPAAVGALGRLEPPVHRRVQGAIALLAQEPRPPAARALRGRHGLRIRVGDYRIIYIATDDVLLVVVVTLGHRRAVYDRCPDTAGAQTSGGSDTQGTVPARSSIEARVQSGSRR